MKDDIVLKVENLSLTYGSNIVLSNVNFSLEKGKIYGIIGPNGAGKSSLLKGILGLVKTQQGKVDFFNSMDNFWSKTAYIEQRQDLDWNFPISVLQMVAMARVTKKNWWKRISKNDQDIVKYALDKLGLTDLQKRTISELSGGQQQRTVIARALAQEAELYFLDEPFVGVDAASQEKILVLFKELKKEGKTIVIVHHDLSLLEKYFDEAILIKGELVKKGSAIEIMNSEELKRSFGFL